MKTALFLAAALLAGNAVADTLYKCSDHSGMVLYTNQRTSARNCKVLYVNGNSNFGGWTRRASAKPTPSDFPRVSSEKQRERDETRRTILEQELAREQGKLDAAQKAKDADNVQLHQRNIAALQKELSSLK